MFIALQRVLSTIVACLALASAAQADWSFRSGNTPNAFIQTGNMTLELQCDRALFSPVAYEDSQDILARQQLSFRFMSNGSTEAAAFHAGSINTEFSIVNDYPVQFVVIDQSDYSFILNQLAQNAVLNLSRVEDETSYGIFSLKGSSKAIKSLRTACASSVSISQPIEAPEGIVYCGGEGIKRVIEYTIQDSSRGPWDAFVTVNGASMRAMTSHSYFGNTQTPRGFEVALLAEDRSEFLVFRDGQRNWIEYGDYTYEQCN